MDDRNRKRNCLTYRLRKSTREQSQPVNLLV